MNGADTAVCLTMREMTAPRMIVTLFLFACACFRCGNGMQCLNGFLGNEAVGERAAYIGRNVRRERQQALFPDITFTCSGTLHGWFMVLEDRGQARGRNKYPEMQLWRRLGGASSYTKIHSMSGPPLDTTYSNVYKYSGLSIEFQRGDVLGVHQSSDKKSRYAILFQERGGHVYYDIRDDNPQGQFSPDDSDVRSNQSDYPLVGLDSSNPECLAGFLPLSILVAKGRLEEGETGSLSTKERLQVILPQMMLGCSGVINSWMFAAEDRGTGGQRDQYPELQLWRPSVVLTSHYSKVATAGALQPDRTNTLNVYEYMLDPPMEFIPGDIVGVYYPEEESSAFSLFNKVDAELLSYSTQRNSPATSSFTTLMDHSATGRPLLAVTISPDCGLLPPLENGNVLAAESTTGAMATYKCNLGYQLIGAGERICQELDGTWSGAAPTCQRTGSWVGVTGRASSGSRHLPGAETGMKRRSAVDCGNPPSLPHGQVALPGGVTTFETVATYTCIFGYRLVGESRRTCLETGSWSQERQECQLIICSPLTSPDNGLVEIKLANGEIDIGTTANYSCAEGYVLFGTKIRVCLGSGEWSGSEPQCRVVLCRELADPANGRVVSTSTGMGGASYTCNNGYILVGESERTCVNGRWTGIPPTCVVTHCDDPLSPSNGSVMYSNTTFSTVATYVCDEGFMLEGEETVLCRANGSWSGDPPTCTLSSKDGGIQPSGGGEETPPTHSGLLKGANIIVVAILAALAVLAILVGVVVAALCIWCKRNKYLAGATSKAHQQQLTDTVENPIYQAEKSPDMSWRLTEHQNQPSIQTLAAHPHSTAPDYDPAPAVIYDLPHVFSTKRGATPESPHYATASTAGAVYHSYELPTIDPLAHYEMDTSPLGVEAALASQYEIPVSPYVQPTSKTLQPSTDIYGTLQWGTFVLTEEQRRQSVSTACSMSDFQSLESLTPLSINGHKTFFSENAIYWKPATDSASLYDQLARNKYREIHRRQIQLTQHLGSGQFGTVDKGIWQPPGGATAVAVKTLKEGSAENDRVKFLQEAAINGQFSHPNVVKLHGVVTVGEPVMIVLELLSNGDLHKHLINSRPAPGELMASDWPHILLKFCREVALGMQYLSGKAFVHRDLATRNILLTEDMTCKIGDFGMSRDLMDESYYISHGGKIPVKWTAPEALHYKKYSTASDVWSFGAVVYEIWSLGHKPFAGYTNHQVVKLIDHGYRLSPPPGCPRRLYEVMVQCWHPKTSSRPSFTTLVQIFSQAEADLLIWSEDDLSVHSQVSVLGAPLEAAKDLYPQLQTLYAVSESEQGH